LRLTFHGAAAEVTGSCYLVDTGEVKVPARGQSVEL
jgi:predicted metal-dependent RNase